MERSNGCEVNITTTEVCFSNMHDVMDMPRYAKISRLESCRNKHRPPSAARRSTFTRHSYPPPSTSTSRYTISNSTSTRDCWTTRSHFYRLVFLSRITFLETLGYLTHHLVDCADHEPSYLVQSPPLEYSQQIDTFFLQRERKELVEKRRK